MKHPLLLSIYCSFILALPPGVQLHASGVLAMACIIPVESSQTCVDNTGAVGPVTATLSDVADTGFKTSSTSATYTANYGFITGSANTNVTNTILNVAYADSLATGTWWEDWIILNPLNPALIGTTGTGVANIVVSASASISESNSIDRGVANAFWNLDLDIGSAYISEEGGRDSNGNEWGSPDGAAFSLPFSFVWGQQFTGPSVSFYGEAVASGSAEWADDIILDATMDFSSTVNWAGLSDIRDSEGTLAGFTTSSASGTDWSKAISAPFVDLSGTIKTAGGTDICAMVLASGRFMFSCNPIGVFLLVDLPREQDGTVKRQIYADGFFPKIDILRGSTNEDVVMNRSGTCPNYNTPSSPAFMPGSAGKRINISGKVLLQNSQTPICAMALANGQYMFTCDGTGNYALNIPLDSNGQFKLQVYADGFAPITQKFDEFSPSNDVRMARAVECQ